jgi:ElaB/YqjD/DUF883 family membrane-anchored ribosome-binding protein
VSAATSKTGRDSDDVRTNAAATQRVAEKAHQTVDRAAEVATEAERAVRANAARAAEKLKEGEELALETLDESLERVRDYVEKNPLTSAGIAFAAGVLVSVLLRR